MRTKGMHLSGPQRSHEDLGKHHGPIEALHYAVGSYLQTDQKDQRLTKFAKARLRQAIDGFTQEQARKADMLREQWQDGMGRSRY